MASKGSNALNEVRDEDLKRVSPSALEAYLQRRKEWHPAGSMADGVGAFYELAETDDAVVVPASTRFADYSLRMAENVAVIAAHEKREAGYVLEDLLAADDDVVRVSVAASKSGPSLTLADGRALLEASRKLLIAAAWSAESPDWDHVGRPGKEIEAYLRSVRFGHTERGSLVVPIYSPVVPEGRGDDDQIGRRAIMTLVSALDAVQYLTQARSRSPERSTLSVGENVSRGVSSNLCSALSSLIGIGHGVALSVNWALTEVAPQPTDYRVRFRSQDQSLLKAMTSALPEDEWISGVRGLVLGLSWDREKRQRSARVRVVVGDKRRNVVLKKLTRREYENVLEAHRSERDVEFSGVLRHEGRSWWLDGVESIRVVDSAA